MTSFFGPEIPVPFCVASEKHLVENLSKLLDDNRELIASKIRTEGWTENDYVDSNAYETAFCTTVDKYLEIGCHESVLYIKAKGDDMDDSSPSSSSSSSSENESMYTRLLSSLSNKDWPRIMEKKFCLLKPVDLLEISVKEKRSDQRIVPEPDVAFEHTFVRCANTSRKYDKILMKNCLKYFDGADQKHFCQFVNKLFKEQFQTRTSLLIIQRVCDLNTLPMPRHIRDAWSANDANYVSFIRTLQNEFYSTQFDIETFKYVIDCKTMWYSFLSDRVPYPLNQRRSVATSSSFSPPGSSASQPWSPTPSPSAGSSSLIVDERETRERHRLVAGIRELNEGVFKYQQVDKFVELNDRMIFVAAHRQFSRSDTLVERINKKKAKQAYDPHLDAQLSNDIKKLRMEITPEIRPILNSLRREIAGRSRFKH